MNKKFLSILLTLVLACSLCLVTAVPVLAWDEEDICVLDNDDFVFAIGIDYDVPDSGYFGDWEYHFGGDGYNLYEDTNGSGEGNLDEIWVWETLDSGPIPGEKWDVSPDTWYWAKPPTKAEILKDSGVPGKGLDKAPGLQKPFNPDSKAGEHAGKK